MSPTNPYGGIVAGTSIAIAVLGVICLLIHSFIDYFIASRYCPKCYTKNDPELLRELKVRIYKKWETDKHMGKEHLNLIEDWIYDYRYNCCGYEYTKEEHL